jgi:hypothetical protein
MNTSCKSVGVPQSCTIIFCSSLLCQVQVLRELVDDRWIQVYKIHVNAFTLRAKGLKPIEHLIRQTIGAAPQFELSSEDAFLRNPGLAPIWIRKQSFQVSHKIDATVLVTSAVWTSTIHVLDKRENPRVYFVFRPQPYRHFRGTRVDQAHHINLMISFYVVFWSMHIASIQKTLLPRPGLFAPGIRSPTCFDEPGISVR